LRAEIFANYFDSQESQIYPHCKINNLYTEANIVLPKKKKTTQPNKNLEDKNP
jgi:hypothetical protein